MAGELAGKGIGIIILLFILIFGLALMIPKDLQKDFSNLSQITYGNHAVDKHKDKAEETRQCLENKNILFVMTNFLTGRCAVVGKLGENKYGIQIRAGEREVTSFVKEDLLKTIIRYLENRGYFLPPE